MSRFTFMYMTDGDIGCVVFNKKLWTKQDALDQAEIELDLFGDEAAGELEIFSSYTSYGYYLDAEDQVQNGWSIPDCHNQYMIGMGEKYKVPVWVVKIKDK